MPQPDHVSKLGVPEPSTLDGDLQEVWTKCVDKLGYVPNVQWYSPSGPSVCVTL